ncbi:MAG: hypothetical protein ACLP1D_18395 [Xanthobacteraceae bacterium]
MKQLVEMRSQAAQCRQLAIREPANRAYWLGEADRWSRREQEEISALFGECNAIPSAGESGRTPSLVPTLAPA